jgi:hypothetical protein
VTSSFWHCQFFLSVYNRNSKPKIGFGCLDLDGISNLHIAFNEHHLIKVLILRLFFFSFSVSVTLSRSYLELICCNVVPSPKFRVTKKWHFSRYSFSILE